MQARGPVFDLSSESQQPHLRHQDLQTSYLSSKNSYEAKALFLPALAQRNLHGVCPERHFSLENLTSIAYFSHSGYTLIFGAKGEGSPARPHLRDTDEHAV